MNKNSNGEKQIEEAHKKLQVWLAVQAKIDETNQIELVCPYCFPCGEMSTTRQFCQKLTRTDLLTPLSLTTRSQSNC